MMAPKENARTADRTSVVRTDLGAKLISDLGLAMRMGESARELLWQANRKWPADKIAMSERKMKEMQELMIACHELYHVYDPGIITIVPPVWGP